MLLLKVKTILLNMKTIEYLNHYSFSVFAETLENAVFLEYAQTFFFNGGTHMNGGNTPLGTTFFLGRLKSFIHSAASILSDVIVGVILSRTTYV